MPEVIPCYYCAEWIRPERDEYVRWPRNVANSLAHAECYSESLKAESMTEAEVINIFKRRG